MQEAEMRERSALNPGHSKSGWPPCARSPGCSGRTPGSPPRRFWSSLAKSKPCESGSSSSNRPVGNRRYSIDAAQRVGALSEDQARTDLVHDASHEREADRATPGHGSCGRLLHGKWIGSLAGGVAQPEGYLLSDCRTREAGRRQALRRHIGKRGEATRLADDPA